MSSQTGRSLPFTAAAIPPICTVGKRIENPEDLSGLAIRASNSITTRFVTAIGANPVSMVTMETYNALKNNVIDGLANDYCLMDNYMLYEPIDYCFDYPVTHSPYFVLMNKDLYESMDDDLKAVIDDFSTGYAGAMGGYWWDSCNYSVQDAMIQSGAEIITPSDEMAAYLSSEEIVARSISSSSTASMMPALTDLSSMNIAGISLNNKRLNTQMTGMNRSVTLTGKP